MEEAVNDPEEQYEKLKKESESKLKSIKRLSINEDFRNWIDDVVKPNMEALSAELASEKADEMPEVVLRAKLKHLNSLKYLFEDVFVVVAQQLEE